MWIPMLWFYGHYSVKRSDVIPPYFIVLASLVKTKEVKVIEFHRINILIPTDLTCEDWL